MSTNDMQCIHGKMMPGTVFDKRTRMGDYLRDFQANQTAIFMQHFSAYLELITRGYAFALVLDSRFTAVAADKVMEIIENIASMHTKFDMVDLAIYGSGASCSNSSNETYNRLAVCKASYLRGTGAYIVSNAGAHKMFRTLPMRWHIGQQASTEWLHDGDSIRGAGLHMNTLW
eukprot:CAMPEP_0119113948 /NCGR_PEP_ID=MMETSP1180-20130426/45693_1 /TAXON_ID=3052 ORGANISM="Chlamydomonas cf sp, Strain CCMP681" /NCGR_SAMPLE_ID=MMETSP1180 /ASSEMBLY_ACC=CAM_ASM_000741 /LENGTH=172 /DNA_ID=CAMNT_0007102265 /DNA_START=661 /DNA_END=1176 /DNA_ORIENTATION=-